MTAAEREKLSTLFGAAWVAAYSNTDEALKAHRTFIEALYAIEVTP